MATSTKPLTIQQILAQGRGPTPEELALAIAAMQIEEATAPTSSTSASSSSSPSSSSSSSSSAGKSESIGEATDPIDPATEPISNLTGWMPTDIRKDQIPDMVAERLPKYAVMCQSTVYSEQLEGAQGMRKLLSIETSPPIDAVIGSGATANLMTFLDSDADALVFEAAWALTNVASGSSAHVSHLEDLGVIPKFIGLLRHKSHDVAEQAVWAIGNIAGDSPRYRDLVLSLGAMPGLLTTITEASKLSMLRNATWTMSNLCRGKPQPAFHMVAECLPVLARLTYSTDDEVLTDAMWALSYLSDGENTRIQAVIEAGVCRRLVEMLAHANANIIVPALRTVGNIVTGDDLQTQVVLNCGILTMLPRLLRFPRVGIRKESCWAISNLTAGNSQQIQAVIEANLFPILFNIVETETDWSIKKEALWAISNATSGANRRQAEYLVSNGVLERLAQACTTSDVRILGVCFEGIGNLLSLGEDMLEENSAEYQAFVASGAPPPSTNPYFNQLQASPYWHNVVYQGQCAARGQLSLEDDVLNKVFRYCGADFDVMSITLPESFVPPSSSPSVAQKGQRKKPLASAAAAAAGITSGSSAGAPGGPDMMDQDDDDDMVVNIDVVAHDDSD